VTKQSVQVIRQNQLPLSNIARELVGADLAVGVCIIFVDAEAGAGPGLHKHPYEEVFITLEGDVTFTAADQELHATAGDIVIVPANTPHAFTNSGTGRLRQIDIHVSPSFETEWL
jgi:mannose-6-phosphate isomerase-like protein (cupin superfamily)